MLWKDVLCENKAGSGGLYLQQQISPAVPLVGGDGDVQWMDIGQTVSLMNETTGKIQQISRFQHHVHDGLPDLCLTEISLKRTTAQRMTRDINTETKSLSMKVKIVYLRLDTRGKTSSSEL